MGQTGEAQGDGPQRWALPGGQGRGQEGRVGTGCGERGVVGAMGEGSALPRDQLPVKSSFHPFPQVGSRRGRGRQALGRDGARSSGLAAAPAGTGQGSVLAVTRSH